MYDILLEESDKVEKSFIWQSSSDFVCIHEPTTQQKTVIIIILRLRVKTIHPHTKLLRETRVCVLLLAVSFSFLSLHHQHCYCYYYHNQGKDQLPVEKICYNSLSWRSESDDKKRKRWVSSLMFSCGSFIRWRVGVGVPSIFFWHSCTFLSFVP